MANSMVEELLKKAQDIQDEAFFEGDVKGFFMAGEDIRAYEGMLKK